MVIVSGIVFLVLGFTNSMDRSVYFKSGSKPSTATRIPCSKCLGDNHDTHEWKVQDKITATFNIGWGGLGDGELEGPLAVDLPETCTGTVRWSLQADGHRITHGTLNQDRSTADPRPRVPGDADTLTLTATWDEDSPSCPGFALIWNDPVVHTGFGSLL